MSTSDERLKNLEEKSVSWRTFSLVVTILLALGVGPHYWSYSAYNELFETKLSQRKFEVHRTKVDEKLDKVEFKNFLEKFEKRRDKTSEILDELKQKVTRIETILERMDRKQRGG